MTGENENVLPISLVVTHSFGALAEMRFADNPDMQAAHGWGWQDAARQVLDEHLAAHADAIAEWSAGAEARALARAERANREFHEARAAREAELQAGLDAHDADGRLLTP